MKKINWLYLVFSIVIISTSSCYKLQRDYEYKPFVLDPNINKSAKEFLLSRGSAGVGSDTIFKWMQLGLEYAGIDLAEYEKPGRTFIFLHNNAVRTLGTVGGVTNQVNGGFFFDHSIPVFDASGNPIKSRIDPTADSLRPARTWTEYPQQLVKNYFLYLILQGEYSFENLGVTNQSIQTLLPPGTVVNPRESRLGWVVTKATPNPDAASATLITYNSAGGGGFDPEGKINLTLRTISGSPQDAPLTINDRVPARSAGYFATNGKVHVFDRTIPPFRYSY